MPDININPVAIVPTSAGSAMDGPIAADQTGGGQFAEVLGSLTSIPTSEVPVETLSGMPGIKALIPEPVLPSGQFDLSTAFWLTPTNPDSAEGVPLSVQNESDSLNDENVKKTEPTGVWEALWAAGLLGGASLLPEPAITSVTEVGPTTEDIGIEPLGTASVPLTTGTVLPEVPVQTLTLMAAASSNSQTQAVESAGFNEAAQAAMAFVGKKNPDQPDADDKKTAPSFDSSESVNLMGSETIQAARPLKTKSSENGSSFVPQPFVNNNPHPEARVQPAEQVSDFGSGLAKGKGEPVVLNLPVLQTEQSLNDLHSRFDYHPSLITHQTHSQSNAVSDFAVGDKVSVNRDELFSQLVEHAKVMVDGGDSQMEISLKPEHLGKVHLKVALENHIISAKFVAESEQVRQVIESNLVQLRKSLNESGVQIDSLVVSTGYQSGAEGFGQQWAGNQGNGQRFGGGGYTVAGWSEDEPVTSQDGNPEPVGDSLINLIA